MHCGNSIIQTNHSTTQKKLLLVAATLSLLAVLVVVGLPFMILQGVLRWLSYCCVSWRRSPRDMRVAVIGAGWSGLQMLARFKELGELIAHEKVRNQGDLVMLDTWDEAVTFGQRHPTISGQTLAVVWPMSQSEFGDAPAACEVVREKQYGSRIARLI